MARSIRKIKDIGIRCEKTGKVKYMSHTKANEGIGYIFRNDPNVKIGDLHSYVCSSCGWVHIGHRIPKVLRYQ